MILNNRILSYTYFKTPKIYSYDLWPEGPAHMSFKYTFKTPRPNIISGSPIMYKKLRGS